MQTVAYTYRENVLTSQKSEKNARSGYRFLYNGMEKDDEVYGDYNSYDFGARLYDPRLGRFLSLDPLAFKYSHNSPYAFSENRVIDKIELEGLEAWEPKNAKVDVMNLRDFDLRVKEEIIPLAKQEHGQLMFDCNDLALFVVMKYFEIKGVEFSISVNGRDYSSRDKKYKDFGQFFEKVRGVLSSSYTKENLLTDITPNEVVAGDVLVSNVHTTVLTQVNIDQSDFDSFSGSGSYWGRNDPRTNVEPLRASSGYYNFNNADGDVYRLGRWSVLSDVPRGLTPVTELGSMPAIPIPGGSGAQNSLRQQPQTGPVQEDGKF